MTTIAALTLGTTVPGVARAALPNDAWMTRTLSLVQHPTIGMAQATVEKDIYLSTGKYYWNFSLIGGVGSTTTVDVPKADLDRDIYLVQGWYSWQCVINPWKGYYTDWCTLHTPGYSGAEMASGNFVLPISGYGDYLMASVLSPHN
jgi:hypothetical protein